MDKEKQIEEMAKLINGSKCPIEVCPKIDKEQEKVFGACNIHRAQILYDAGYGNVKEALKDFAELVKKRIETDKYTPEITKDYDEEDKNNCEYYNLGLNHAQIIIDFFVKEVCGD